jgi:hypothetical protein
LHNNRNGITAEHRIIDAAAQYIAALSEIELSLASTITSTKAKQKRAQHIYSMKDGGELDQDQQQQSDNESDMQDHYSPTPTNDEDEVDIVEGMSMLQSASTTQHINEKSTVESNATSAAGHHSTHYPRVRQNQRSKKTSVKEMISLAMNECGHPKIRLSEIYEFIIQRFPYYQTNVEGWKNNVRHNLTIHDCFVKVERSETDGHLSPGKGGFWSMRPGSAGAGGAKKGRGSTGTDRTKSNAARLPLARPLLPTSLSSRYGARFSTHFYAQRWYQLTLILACSRCM